MQNVPIISWSTSCASRCHRQGRAVAQQVIRLYGEGRVSCQCLVSVINGAHQSWRQAPTHRRLVVVVHCCARRCGLWFPSRVAAAGRQGPVDEWQYEQSGHGARTLGGSECADIGRLARAQSQCAIVAVSFHRIITICRSSIHCACSRASLFPHSECARSCRVDAVGGAQEADRHDRQWQRLLFIQRGISDKFRIVVRVLETRSCISIHARRSTNLDSNRSRRSRGGDCARIIVARRLFGANFSAAGRRACEGRVRIIALGHRPLHREYLYYVYNFC